MFDAIDHRFTIKRFFEIGSSPSCHDLPVYPLILECGNEYDWRGVAGPAQRIEQLYAAHPLHLHIRYQAVNFDGVSLSQEGFGVRKTMNIEAVRSDQILQGSQQ